MNWHFLICLHSQAVAIVSPVASFRVNLVRLRPRAPDENCFTVPRTSQTGVQQALRSEGSARMCRLMEPIRNTKTIRFVRLKMYREDLDALVALFSESMLRCDDFGR